MAPANSLTAALAVAGGGISSGEDYMAAAILAPRRAPQPSRLGAACVTEKRPTARQALRGPDGSMHETVDGMLEEFENASFILTRTLTRTLPRTLILTPILTLTNPSRLTLTLTRRASPSKAASTASSSAYSRTPGVRVRVRVS